MKRKFDLGYLFVITGLIVMVVAILFLKSYIEMKSTAIISESPETIWHTAAYLFQTAAIGSYLMVDFVILSFTGIIIIFIGIIMLRH